VVSLVSKVSMASTVSRLSQGTYQKLWRVMTWRLFGKPRSSTRPRFFSRTWPAFSSWPQGPPDAKIDLPCYAMVEKGGNYRREGGGWKVEESEGGLGPAEVRGWRVEGGGKLGRAGARQVNRGQVPIVTIFSYSLHTAEKCRQGECSYPLPSTEKYLQGMRFYPPPSTENCHRRASSYPLYFATFNNASISSTSFGIEAERFLLPVLVIRRSSSMRMPIHSE